jgi:hypothetical protein
MIRSCSIVASAQKIDTVSVYDLTFGQFTFVHSLRQTFNVSFLHSLLRSCQQNAPLLFLTPNILLLNIILTPGFLSIAFVLALRALEVGKNNTMAKGLENISSGHAVYRWLSAIGAKQPSWFLDSIEGRSNFGAWIGFRAKRLTNTEFLLRFQNASDPWERSKLVGMRIAQIRKDYANLSKQEKDELGKQSEVEFKTGVELLGRDKQTLMQVISITDPPIPQQ